MTLKTFQVIQCFYLMCTNTFFTAFNSAVHTFITQKRTYYVGPIWHQRLLFIVFNDTNNLYLLSCSQ